MDRRSSNTNTSANLDGCEPQAGRLLPCLVTALTIAREQSVRFAVGLMDRSRDRRDRFFDASGLGRRSFGDEILRKSVLGVIRWKKSV